MLALAPDEDLPWSVAVRPRGGEWSSMVAGGPDRHRREQTLKGAAEPLYPLVQEPSPSLDGGFNLFMKVEPL